MADLGNLNFGVHLVDYTDAEVDKIKKKLESLSIKLNIDASSSKVSNTDSIKTQIENAIKNININSVKVDANAVKTQIESATQNLSPKITVTLLKGSLSNDIQAYLDTKVFKIKISITASQVQSDIVQAMGNISIPVKVRVDSNFMIQQLQQSLSKRSIPINVRANDVKTFVKDLETKLSKTSAKIPLDANWKVIRSSVQNALKGQTFTADLKLVVRTASVDDAIKQAFAKAGMRYNPIGGNSAANANRNLANSYRQAAGAADQFARASVTLSNGLHTNIRLGGQLGTILGNLASVVGMKDLLRDVVLIGGQLENQRIALGSILQDGGKATAMFSKIQSLAVKSPFGIMDLNQYVKQLSAYSVPYNELYDTMKRLADISAGVGVDMGRIILAFGQVKAAGFLKGTELRQFTEANIPMVDKLAERFTNLTGEMVSAGEVYDMISKKKIAFEDVKAVLWDLTDEGGMFNNMQEVLSESLASKWKNLSDAVDVMFGKIADGGVGSGLKWIAELLTDITKGWKYVGAAIGSALSSFLLYKAAVVLGSKQMAAATNLYTSTLANKRVEARNLQIEKSFRNLTKAEQQLIATTNKLTVADLKQLVRSGQLNKTQALRLISLKKLDAQTLAYIKRLYQLTDAQIKLAQGSTWATRASSQFANGLGAIGTALKSLFLNPMTWIFAAISAITEVWTYFSNKSSEANQRVQDSLEAASSGYDNLKQSLKDFSKTPTTDAGLISALDEMSSKLKDYASNWAEIFEEIFKRDEDGEYVHSLSERYDLLKTKLNDTKEAYKLLATEMNGFMESANRATDGSFDESFRDNLLDVSEAMNEYRKQLNDVAREGVRYEKAILAAAAADKEYAAAIEGKSLKEQLDLLKDFEAAKSAFEVGSAYIGMGGSYLVYAINHLKEQQDIALKDAETFAEKYKSLLESKGWDVNNLTEPQKIAIGVDFTQYFDAIEGLDDATKEMFLKETIEKHFNIIVTAKYKDTIEAEKWKLELIDAAGGEELQIVVDSLIKAAPDYNSVVDSIRKMYKESKEIIDNLKPVLIKVGLSPDGLTEIGTPLDPSKFDAETLKAIEGYNKAVREVNAALNISKDQGFTLEEQNKSSSTKDPIAEMWKQRTEEIEKAVAAYDKWKKVEGASKAEQRIKGMDEFANLFNGKYGFNLDLESPTDAYRFIQSKLNQAKEEQRELYVKLGVKLSDAELKDAQDRLKAYLDETKKFIDKTTAQWNLYKNLFKATGDKAVSMNIAFGGNVGFKDQLEQIKSEILKQMEVLGISIGFDELIKMDSVSLEQGGFASLSNLIDAYNKENKKLKDESIKNFIDIINVSKDFEQRIVDIERELQKDLEDLRSNATGMPRNELKRREDELVKRAGEEKTKIRFEEFKESSDWVKVFDDLDRVSDDTLDNMTRKIEEFAKQAHLSEEVTKQLVDAMAKLRNETIERNPFKGFKEAYQKLNNYKDALKQGTVGGGMYQVKQLDGTYKLLTKTEVNDGITEANEDLENSALAVANKFQAVANAASLLNDLFANMGINMDGFLGAITDVLGGAASGAQTGAGIASAFGLAGPWGAVAGAAVGMLSSVFAMHDKALQKEIEDSEAREELIRNIADNLESRLEYNLGGLYTISLDKDSKALLEDISITTGFEKFGQFLGSETKYSDDTIKKAREAAREDSYFDAQLAALMAQRDELKHQQKLEQDKKKTDEQKIADYEQQIKQTEADIKNFALDMANTLYGIDFKDWASQLSESLVNAWATGEDAVRAYKNTVTDILRDLGVSIITQKIIEPMLNDTMNQFLSQFEKDNGQLTNASMEILAGVYDQAEFAASATEAYLEGLKKLGIDLSEKDEEEKSGLSKGIQSVTEDTASLLASYINAIRTDVSIKRTLLERLIAEDIPQISVLAQAQLTQLNNIAANTLRNADAADRIYELFNRVIDKGSNKIKI